MDPHAFDQSLQKTSPKMDPAVRMMFLRQGTRSIEDYVVDFLELAHLTHLDELCLMIFFRGGLSEPLSSIMPLHDPNWMLESYIDVVLQLSGSPFTVGIAESAPEPAESAPEPAESAPEPAESAPEPAESAPEPAESAPEPAESAPEPAESVPHSSPLVPPSSPSSPLVPPSSPSSPLVPPSSPSPWILSSLALSERPRDPAPPECPLEVVEFTKNFHGGSSPPLLTETPDPPWPMESPDSSWLPEALDLPWPPKLPASVLEIIGALSVSCVSVSSRSQSLPWVSALPWWAPVSSAPPWWAPVSSAPPWWAPVSSAPPWWAPVSSAPPWWVPDLPESPHASADLPESPHASADLPESPHASADLPESPYASADLPESPHASADATTELPESPHATVVYPVSLHVPAVSSALPWWAPVSLAPHGPGPPSLPPVPPPLHRPPGLCFVEAALRGGGGSVMNLVATHYNCTSPMDYISLHALHSHIPIHHYTNHTAVTIHSLALIVSPHLIHSPTYKQHTSLHTLRCLVLAPADIFKRYSSC